jgi:hypothetical protein
MTPILFEKYANAYSKRRQSELELIDTANHQLGRYISFAFHDPGKYPTEPAFSKSENSNTSVITSDEELERIARIKYGKKE